MSWIDLEPYASPGGTCRIGAIMLSASRPDGRYRPFTIITIRPRFWNGELPPWLAIGARIKAQIGTGDTRGQLRLVPGDLYLIGTFPKGDGLRINLPLLPGQKPGKQKPMQVEYDWNDQWVSIDLPAWAKPAAAVPQPALSPEVAKRLGLDGRAAA